MSFNHASWLNLWTCLDRVALRTTRLPEPAQSHPGSVPRLDDFIETGHEGGVNLACKLLRKAFSKQKETPNATSQEVVLAMTRALFFVVAPVDLLETTWPGQTTLQDIATNNGKSAFKQHNYKGGARCYWTLRIFLPFFCFCSLLTSTIESERERECPFLYPFMIRSRGQRFLPGWVLYCRLHDGGFAVFVLLLRWEKLWLQWKRPF